VNKNPTCNSMQIFIHCRTTLHVLGVTAPIIRNIKNCTRSLRYRSYCKMQGAIWYNKTCQQRQLTPAYVNIRINGKNQQCQKTLRTANQYRINHEIKFLYTKKNKLNEQLFKLHLKCADNMLRYHHPLLPEVNKPTHTVCSF